MVNAGHMNAWELIKMGGVLMIPIMICSVIAFAVFIEKILYFRSIGINTLNFKKQIFELVKNNKIKEAIQLCETNASPIAKILKAGIIKFGSSREEIKENLEIASLQEAPKLENKMNILFTIVYTTPLLGIVGTVSGMVSLFQVIQIRSAALSPIAPGDLVAGLGEALITTMAGLLVMIPSFVAYNYCLSRVSYFTLEMAKAATETVNFLTSMTETNP